MAAPYLNTRRRLRMPRSSTEVAEGITVRISTTQNSTAQPNLRIRFVSVTGTTKKSARQRERERPGRPRSVLLRALAETPQRA